MEDFNFSCKILLMYATTLTYLRSQTSFLGINSISVQCLSMFGGMCILFCMKNVISILIGKRL